jgi:hypothetical protein
MDEHPAQSVRAKRDSSIVVGCRLVKEGQADAFFSAGSTGACMAAATLVMGRSRRRPSRDRDRDPHRILTGRPARRRRQRRLQAEHLFAFAHMGAAYAETVLGVSDPRRLLNIGEEPDEGLGARDRGTRPHVGRPPGIRRQHRRPRRAYRRVDVIVTDGFTGNVALKLLEGTSRVLLGQVKDVMTATLRCARLRLPSCTPGSRLEGPARSRHLRRRAACSGCVACASSVTGASGAVPSLRRSALPRLRSEATSPAPSYRPGRRASAGTEAESMLCVSFCVYTTRTPDRHPLQGDPNDRDTERPHHRGRLVPARARADNADLERMVDTSDEWIMSRTGIRERRIVRRVRRPRIWLSRCRWRLKDAGVDPRTSTCSSSARRART